MRHLLLLAAGGLFTVGAFLAWVPLGFITCGGCCVAAWVLLAPTDPPGV